MENWIVEIVLFMFVATLTVLLGLVPSRNRNGGRGGRRLFHITTVLSEAPSSTMVVRVPFLSRRHILTADPENVKHILKTNFQNYPKGEAFRSTLDELFGECIVNADGQEWQTQRAFVAREFSASFLQSSGDTVDSEIGDRLLPLLTKASTSRLVIDLQDVLLRFALDNICRAAFSYDPESLSLSAGSGHLVLPRSELSEAFDNGVFLMGNRIKSMLPPKVLWMKKAFNIGNEEREIKKSSEAVKRIIMDTLLVQNKINHNDNNNDHHLAAAGNFLSRLPKLIMQLQGGYVVDKCKQQEFMANMVAGVILAGRDTTSAVLTWFFWLVSTTPRVEANILEEIANLNNVIADHKAGTAREMPYTHAALCETMRLYPPIPLVVKEAQNDDALPADGTPVNTGDRVVIVSYAMGRLETVWGPDCKDFRPERWLIRRTDSSSSSSWRFVGTDPYRFPAFNAGPRICPGKEMAFQQMKRVVTAVLGRFRVVPAALTSLSSSHPEPEFVFDITAKMKGGFPVRLEARQSIHVPTFYLRP